MLRINQLRGFNRLAGAATVTTVPDSPNPSYAYHFEQGDELVDSIGSSDLVANTSYSTTLAGKSGGALLFEESSYIERSGIVNADFSLSGWVAMIGSDTGGIDLDFNPVTVWMSSSFFALRFLETTTGDFQAWIQAFPGSWELASSDSFPAGSYVHFTFSVAEGATAEIGAAFVVNINGTPHTYSQLAANSAAGGYMRINGSSTIMDNSYAKLDELYVWPDDPLTAAEIAWLYNGGTGHFWDSSAGDWA
tara:strand:+ start:18657 stop:19403 length:747 start_codon:yes stop_codon:yes gene_type:complete